MTEKDKFTSLVLTKRFRSPNRGKNMKYSISATYGSQNTPCTVFVYELPERAYWYAVEGSQTVNKTYDAVADGVDVETLSDIDCFTWSKPIESLEELQTAVES